MADSKYVKLGSEELLMLAVRAHLYDLLPAGRQLWSQNGRDDGFVAELTGKPSKSKRINLSDARPIAEALERRTGATPGFITGYISRCEADKRDRYRATIGRAWARSVEASGRQDALDALIIGEAIIGFQVKDREVLPNDHLGPQLLDDTWSWVLDRLTTLGAAGHDGALRQLTFVCAYRLPTVVGMLESGIGGTTVRLARPLERAIRFKLLGKSSARRVVKVVANPDPTQQILRPTSWIRLLRRCALELFPHPPAWSIQQLSLAIARKKSYKQISPIEHRYASWTALELLAVADEKTHERWAGEVHGLVADENPSLLDLSATAAPHRDWPKYRPDAGWPLHDAVRNMLMSHLTVNTSKDVGPDDAKWPRQLASLSGSRESIIEPVQAIIIEAVSTPCAVRYTTAADLLAALPASMRGFLARQLRVSTMKLLDGHHGRSAEVVPHVERMILLAGHIAGADTALASHVTRFLSEDLLNGRRYSPWVRRAAAWQLGQVARHASNSRSATGVLQDVMRNDSCVQVVNAAKASMESLSVREWPQLMWTNSNEAYP